MLLKNWMSRDVITVDADQSMHKAINLLQEHGINVLPVLENGELTGIISDRNLKKASPSDATTLDMHELLYLVSRIKVRDIMTKELYTIPFDYTIEEAAAILLEKKISALPVMDRKKMVGIITRSDIFRVLISMTGIGKVGVSFAVCLENKPGAIKEIREIIRQYGARTANVLSIEENVPSGFFNVYFRMYRIDRERLVELTEKLKSQTKLLYVIDHRENKRTEFMPEFPE